MASKPKVPRQPMQPIFEVGDRVLYLDNEDPTDTGMVISVSSLPRCNFPYEVRWDNDDANDWFSGHQLGVVRENVESESP